MKTMQKKLMAIIVVGIVLATLISGTASLLSFSSVGKERSNLILSKELEVTSSNLNDICINVEHSVFSLSKCCLDEFPGLSELQGEKGTAYIKDIKNLAKTLVDYNEYVCAVYYRFDPELLGPTAGFFLTRTGTNHMLSDVEPTDITKYPKEDLEHVAWFYGPINAGKAVWLDPYMNRNNDILTLTYAQPVYTEDGTFVGVVGVDIDLKKVYDRISKTRIYDTGFAAMLSSKGEVLYSPRKLNIQPEVVKEIISNDRTEGLSYLDRQQEMKILSQKLTNGDYVLVSIAVEDLYDLEYRVVFSIMLITLFVGVCIIAILTGILNKLFYKFKTDTLTGTENRGSYMEDVFGIDSEIRAGHKQSFSLVIFDINGLKRVNDELGHTAGDQLIKSAAELIKKNFTQGAIYRVGGDEFVYLYRKKSQTYVTYLFEKFKKEMDAKARDYDPNSDDVVLSAGMAVYDPNTDNCFEDTFRRADQEMYSNKSGFYKVNKFLDRRK